MPSAKLIFNTEEVQRLKTKIGQVSQDTNRLYLQMKGQASGWGGIPMGDHLANAQALIHELTAEAEKLEDIIWTALKGVEGLQEENKQKAEQVTGRFSLIAAMFGRFRTQDISGQVSIPPAAQKAAANLITSFAALLGRDELDGDPVVKQLQNTIRTSVFVTMESIAAQGKLNEIFAARDQIAKAQQAYKIYEAFDNKTQMNAVHRLAEEARQKLASMGVDGVHYEAGKDLSVYFKQPALQACDYDPSITAGSVPLPQTESYLLLLRMAMERGTQGAWAKSQLSGVHVTMGNGGEPQTYEVFWQQGDEYFSDFWWHDEVKVQAAIRVLQEELEIKGMISLPEVTDPNRMIAIQRISGALTKKEWDPSTNDVLQAIMTKYGIHEGNTWELTPAKLEAIVDRYNKGLIGQEAGDFLESSGLAEMVYAAPYDLLGGAGANPNLRAMSSAEAEVAAVNAEFAATRVKPFPKNALPENVKGELDDLSLTVKETGGLDFKLWEDMPFSGQVKLTQKGLKVMSIRDMKIFKKEMREANINVVFDKKGSLLPGKAAGGFDPETGQIVLRSDASYLSSLHESYHAAQYNLLGKEQYLKLSKLEREEFVYNEIMNNKNLFNTAELYEAQRYIFKMRNGVWPLSDWKGFD